MFKCRMNNKLSQKGPVAKRQVCLSRRGAKLWTWAHTGDAAIKLVCTGGTHIQAPKSNASAYCIARCPGGGRHRNPTQ